MLVLFIFVGGSLIIGNLITIFSKEKSYIDKGIYEFKTVSFHTESYVNTRKASRRNSQPRIEYFAVYETKDGQYTFTERVSEDKYEKEDIVNKRVIAKEKNPSKYSVTSADTTDFRAEEVSNALKAALVGLLFCVLGILILILVWR